MEYAKFEPGMIRRPGRMSIFAAPPSGGSNHRVFDQFRSILSKFTNLNKDLNPSNALIFANHADNFHFADPGHAVGWLHDAAKMAKHYLRNEWQPKMGGEVESHIHNLVNLATQYESFHKNLGNIPDNWQETYRKGVVDPDTVGGAYRRPEGM